LGHKEKRGGPPSSREKKRAQPNLAHKGSLQTPKTEKRRKKEEEVVQLREKGGKSAKQKRKNLQCWRSRGRPPPHLEKGKKKKSVDSGRSPGKREKLRSRPETKKRKWRREKKKKKKKKTRKNKKKIEKKSTTTRRGRRHDYFRQKRSRTLL